MSEIVKGVDSDQRFLQKWGQAFKYLFPRYVIMSVAAIEATMISAAFSVDPETPPYAQETFSNADPQVLWDAKESSNLILLGPNSTCPQGGNEVSDTVTLDIATSINNGARYTLRVQTLYELEGKDGASNVACGYDAGEGEIRFAGSAVISTGTEKILS